MVLPVVPFWIIFVVVRTVLARVSLSHERRRVGRYTHIGTMLGFAFAVVPMIFAVVMVFMALLMPWTVIRTMFCLALGLPIMSTDRMLTDDSTFCRCNNISMSWLHARDSLIIVLMIRAILAGINTQVRKRSER